MVELAHRVAIKRAYEPTERGDGVPILVDRLWPRGLRKDAANFDAWRKEVSPSTALRQFYDHRPERFAKFATRYRAELRNKDAMAAVAELIDLAGCRPVTLLRASRDLEHSEAAVLAKHIRQVIARRTGSSRSRATESVSH